MGGTLPQHTEGPALAPLGDKAGNVPSVLPRPVASLSCQPGSFWNQQQLAVVPWRGPSRDPQQRSPLLALVPYRTPCASSQSSGEENTHPENAGGSVPYPMAAQRGSPGAKNSCKGMRTTKSHPPRPALQGENAEKSTAPPQCRIRTRSGPTPARVRDPLQPQLSPPKPRQSSSRSMNPTTHTQNNTALAKP